MIETKLSGSAEVEGGENSQRTRVNDTTVANIYRATPTRTNAQVHYPRWSTIRIVSFGSISKVLRHSMSPLLARLAKELVCESFSDSALVYASDLLFAFFISLTIRLGWS